MLRPALSFAGRNLRQLCPDQTDGIPVPLMPGTAETVVGSG